MMWRCRDYLRGALLLVGALALSYATIVVEVWIRRGMP